MTLLQRLHDHQEAFEKALGGIRQEMKDLKTDLNAAILRTQHQHLSQSQVPTEPVSTPDPEHEPGVQRRLVTPADEDEQPVEQVQSSHDEPTHHLNLNAVSDETGVVMDQLTDRSLRAACHRVIESQQQGGNALRPFRASN